MAPARAGRREQPGHGHGHSHPTRARTHQPPSPLAPLPLPTLPSAHPSPSQPDFTGQLPLISQVPSTCRMYGQVHENLINLNTTAGFSCWHPHRPAPAGLDGSALAPRDPAPRDCGQEPQQALHHTGSGWEGGTREGGQRLQVLLHALLCHRGARSTHAQPWGCAVGLEQVSWPAWGYPSVSAASSLVGPACDPGAGRLLSLLWPWEGITWQVH